MQAELDGIKCLTTIKGGVVTTMDDGLLSGGRKDANDAKDVIKSEVSGLQFIQNQLDAPVKNLKTAGLAPTFEQILEYCAKVDGANLEDALRAFIGGCKGSQILQNAQER